MSYNIDRYDLNTMSGLAMSNTYSWNTNLTNVLDSFNRLIEDEGFTGNGADAIKAYVQYVHVFAIESINLALSEFMGKIVTYAEGFSDYDADDEAKLNEDTFTWVTNKLDEISLHIRNTTPEGQRWIDYVSDIVPDHNLESADSYAEPMETESKTIKTLRDNIGEYDASFSGDTLANVKALIADARKLIDKVNSDGVVSINTEYIASFFTEDSLKDMLDHINSAMDYCQRNQDKISQGAEYLAKVFDDRQRRAEEQARQARIEKGIILIGGAIIGTVMTVVTCGAAAPGVATYITVGLGTLIVVNNVADFAEGAQDIYLALNNDFETQSLNVMRDVAFEGNADAYEVYKLILSGSQATVGSVSAIQTAGSNALANGTSVELAKLGAAGEEVFKTYGGIAVDAASEKAAEYMAGDDELLKFILNQTFSIAGNQALEHGVAPSVGKGVENFAGKHFGDKMSPGTPTATTGIDLSDADAPKLDTDIKMDVTAPDVDQIKIPDAPDVDTNIKADVDTKTPDTDGIKVSGTPTELDTKVEVPEDVAAGAAAVEVTKTEVFTSKEVRDLAKKAIHGPAKSDMVFLGKHNDGTGAKPYDELAKEYGAQYFELDSWDELDKTHSGDEMWRINEQYLIEQVSSGRDIYLTSDPEIWGETDTGFGREVRFLKENGFTFEQDGDMWYAVPH
ncbi:MAG: hypothetical protein IJM25_11895 [Eubacterium sp.]|nr:hypothetical protein [Eubacterium sp.]